MMRTTSTLSTLLALLTLLLYAVPPRFSVGKASPGTVALQVGWRVQVEAGESIRSTLTINNRCAEPHLFRVKSNAKYLQFAQPTDSVSVAPGANQQLAVRFDAAGLKPKVYQSKVIVECLDCKGTRCTQDRDELRVELTVIKASASLPANSPPAGPVQGGGGITSRPVGGTLIRLELRDWHYCRGIGYGCLVIRLPGPWWPPRVPGAVSAAPSFDGNAEVHEGAQPVLRHVFNSAPPEDVRAIPIEKDVPLDGAVAEALGYKGVTILKGTYPIDARLGKTGGVVFKVSIRGAWKVDPRNPDNPFDATGRRHNEALDHLLTRKEKFVVNGGVMKDAVFDELAEKVCADEAAHQSTVPQESSQADCVAKVARQMRDGSPAAGKRLDKMNLSAKFTKAQIKTLKEIEAQIESAFDESGKGPAAAIRNIKAVEAHFLKTMSRDNAEANEVILGSSSVARYTIAYWFDEGLDDHRRWRDVGGGGTQAKTKKRYKDAEAAKEDFNGAVEGGIGGFAAAGPFGGVMGVVGGAVGRSVVNIGRQLGWW